MISAEKMLVTKSFGPWSSKIYGRAFQIRGCDNAQAVYPVLDGLPFLHHLHNFLLGLTFLDSCFSHSLLGEVPDPSGTSPIYRLEACDVLSLKALRPFFTSNSTA